MIGRTLGAYEIREEIGSGGAATVYRAYQPNVDRDVAIKVITQSLAGDDQAVARFQREARLIARLEHPHILPVYDFDGGHDPPYIVTRYLDGGSLAEVLAQGLLPLAEVSRLVRQVGSALDYAHRQGIIHRDVKPSNILFDCEGNAFVTDFGLARMVSGLDRSRPTTVTWAVIGTPHYMAPEQAMASADVDHRADVYALGVILFEMLTWELPYLADDAMSMLGMHMHAPIPSAVERNPELPPTVDDVVTRALAKEREERYPSAAALVEAVTAALEGTPAGRPARLRQAFEGAVTLRPVRPEVRDITAERTPTEQNKTVTALYANAAEYAELVDEISGSEAARQALNALWDAAEEITDSHGGLVVSRTEDTLLALWGAEVAREDDAERAVRAALAMQASLLEQGADVLAEGGDEPLPLNIGINSGLALLTPGAQSGDFTASGATISLANRAVQHADGTILVTHNAYNQVRGVFDVELDIPLRMRRSQGTVQTYRVLGARPRAFRVETRGVEGVETQMVGREAELKALHNAFLDAVEEAETQVVTVCGQAGLGKSRLLYEFVNWAELRPEKFRLLRGRATPEMTNRPYALLRDLISFQFDIRDSDNPAVVRQKLEKGIEEEIGPNQEMAHMLGHLAGFDFTDSPFVKALLSDPGQLTERAKQLFSRCVVQLCAAGPIIVALEDIHHADDASLDLLNGLVREHDDLPLLVICLARPTVFERRPTWGSGQHFHTRLELRPLDRRESRRLVREVLQEVEHVPKALRDLLVERAEGNPYYLEELVKMLIDDRVIIKDSEDIWRVEASRLGYLPVPATLVGLLQARLDSLLYPEKLILQRAAVVGRIFFDSALAELDAADEVHLEDLPGILKRLAERGFIHQRETTAFESSTEYIFAGAMLRDVLVSTLLRRQQQTYNAAAAAWLIDASVDRVEEYSGLIAEHYALAGERSAAADWFSRAGERALAHGAPMEARQFFNRALELVSPTDRERRWRALLGRDEALGMLGDTEARLADDAAVLELAREMGDDNRLAEAFFRQGNHAAWMGDDRRALQAFAAALAAAERAENVQLETQVLGMKAVSHTRLGEMEAAKVTTERALACALELGDEPTLVRTFHNAAVYYDAAGDHASSIQLLNQHVAINHRLGDRFGEAIGLGALGYNFALLGLYNKGRAALEQALELTEAMGARRLSAYNRLNLGLVCWRIGDGRAAQRVLDEAAPELAAIGDAFGQAFCRSYSALTLEQSGEVVDAELAFAEAKEMLSEMGARGYAVDAAAGMARCALAQGQPEGSNQHAIEVWDYLEQHSAQGMELPILAYQTCADVFEATGDADKARAAVEAGYRALMARAEKISDPEWRVSVLENVPEHRALVERWEQVNS